MLDLVERIAADNEVEVVALRHPPGRVGVSRGRCDRASTRLSADHWRGRAGAGPCPRRACRHDLHRRRPLDVIHALWADEAGAVAVLAARVIRVPAVVSVMGGELAALDEIDYGAALGRGGRWTVQTSLRLADIVTVGSSYLRADGPTPSSRWRRSPALQPLGVDLTTSDRSACRRCDRPSCSRAASSRSRIPRPRCAPLPCWPTHV